MTVEREDYCCILNRTNLVEYETPDPDSCSGEVDVRHMKCKGMGWNVNFIPLSPFHIHDIFLLHGYIKAHPTFPKDNN